MGSKNRTPPASIYADLEIVRSPSHTVGLELPPFPSAFHVVFGCRHPTRWAWNGAFIDFQSNDEAETSPSHTVGLELGMGACKNNTMPKSHHPTQWAWNEEKILLAQTLYKLSPSHTVGSEHRLCSCPMGNRSFLVTIPHGGLGTFL